MRLMGNAGCVRPMQGFLRSLTQVCKERFHQQSFLEASDLLLGDSRASTPSDALQALPLGQPAPMWRAGPLLLVSQQGALHTAQYFASKSCWEESQGAYLHRSTAVSTLPKKQDPAQPPPASWLLKIRDLGGHHKGVCSPIFISPSLKADFCKIK